MHRFSMFLVALLYLPVSVAQQVTEPSPIGYATIEEAYNAKYILWSFTPDDHPAHPSAIRREIVKKGDQILIKMDALCYSNQLDCDLLIDQFKKINERISQDWAKNS
jgi:hypothetical protein